MGERRGSHVRQFLPLCGISDKEGKAAELQEGHVGMGNLACKAGDRRELRVAGNRGEFRVYKMSGISKIINFDNFNSFNRLVLVRKRRDFSKSHRQKKRTPGGMNNSQSTTRNSIN